LQFNRLRYYGVVNYGKSNLGFINDEIPASIELYFPTQFCDIISFKIALWQADNNEEITKL
jgi:hypothetical protein